MPASVVLQEIKRSWGVFGAGHDGVEVGVGVEAAAHAGNDSFFVYFFAVFAAAEVEGVESFLFVDGILEVKGSGDGGDGLD